MQVDVQDPLLGDSVPPSAQTQTGFPMLLRLLGWAYRNLLVLLRKHTSAHRSLRRSCPMFVR
eukprot:3221191-Amphidinium_carterae.1